METEPTPTVYHLAAGPELRPAVPLGRGTPQAVNGLPAHYYWKDAIVAGSYVHPAGHRIDLSRDDLDELAATFKKMKGAGVGVPILADHDPSAASTLGWIVGVKRDGDTLMELHQFLGDDARDTGLRNQVSLGIDPDFVDGKGTAYGRAIVHSAVTPVPVVPGQGPFQPVMTLSRKTAPPPPDAAARQLVEIRRDVAIARGGVDPASAGRLFDLLTASPGLVTLSRDGGPSVAAAVFDALAANRPVPIGEMTGVQALSRLVPGDDRSDLQKAMITMASGG